MKRQKGYTLIELMTKLAVATVLISVAMPGMQSFRMNSRQVGKVNEMISAMHLARNTAITTNTRVTLCSSKTGESCDSVAWDKGWIAFVDRDSDQTVDDDESILRVGPGVDGVTISSGQYSNYLMYRPNGRAMNATVKQNSGQFTICDKRGSKHAKAIMIDLAGRPRVADNDSYGISLSCPSS
jgi:type IV fimbrial biogenesis protein FimT